MHRSKMSRKERAIRSRLKQLVGSGEFVRGTLSVRERVCGKTNCRCAKGGDKHVSVCLVRSKDGHIEQLHIPKGWEERARQWVAQYREQRNLMEKLSDIYWEKLRQRKE